MHKRARISVETSHERDRDGELGRERTGRGAGGRRLTGGVLVATGATGGLRGIGGAGGRWSGVPRVIGILLFLTLGWTLYAANAAGRFTLLCICTVYLRCEILSYRVYEVALH